MNSDTISILVVENNDTDFEAIKGALKAIGHVHVTDNNAQDLAKFLRQLTDREMKYAN